ncbi:MAG: hypothetical protein E7255_02390 [Lachnospiraceae bacterium]|nr:hypothetical protein [Lachnospiraceae bacterium]
MIKLIKLELVKNKLSAYLLASLCILIFGIGFCFMTAFIPQLDNLNGAIPPSVNVTLFYDWSNFISIISVLFAAAFSVLSAVMHTKFTVDEYTGKKAILLFSYPQSKSKILFAKCVLVFFFTIIGAVVCNIAAVGIFAVCSNAFNIMIQPFNATMIPDLLAKSGISALLAASAGIISMRVGFWKKSLVATVVTSFLLIAPFGNIISLFPEHSIEVHLIGMGILLAMGLLIFIELLSKVNKMEAL